MKKRSTIVDVAKECGVPQATVARVLNGKTGIRTKESTKKRVLAAAQKVGYQKNSIAANFRLQQTNSIAVSISDITNPFFPELVKGIQFLGCRQLSGICSRCGWDHEMLCTLDSQQTPVWYYQSEHSPTNSQQRPQYCCCRMQWTDQWSRMALYC